MPRAILTTILISSFVAFNARAGRHPTEPSPSGPTPWDVWRFEAPSPRQLEQMGWLSFKPTNVPDGLDVEIAKLHGKDAVLVGKASGLRWLRRSTDGGERWAPPIFIPPFPPGALNPRWEDSSPCAQNQWGPKRWPEWQPVSQLGHALIQGESLVVPVDEACPYSEARSRRYASVRLEVLTKDTDKDGLSDLFEITMRLNPENPDTDGDKIRDDVDPLPQIPLSQQGGVPAALLAQWSVDHHATTLPASKDSTDNEARVASDGGLQTVCLIGDPALLQGPSPTKRLIIVSGLGFTPPCTYLTYWMDRDKQPDNGKRLGWRVGGYAGGLVTFVRGEAGWTVRSEREWQQ